MAYILPRNDRSVPYTLKERNLFRLLPQDGKRISTTQLARRYYHSSQMPMNANVLVVNGVRALKEKVDKNREPFRVRKTARAGPHPIEYWVEKRR